MKPRIATLLAFALISALLPIGRSLAQPIGPEDLPAGRETEPVVLTGASFPSWATLGNVALKGNSAEGLRCFLNQEGAGNNPVTPDESCTHNQYDDPDFSSADHLKNAGVPIDRILGYQWDGDSFEQIPFQVDEMFTRYLSNNNSGFAHYSGTDQHTSYAFDREGFRWTDSDPSNPCLAQPASEVAKDPVPGLDTDDELVFMAKDAGASAPSEAALPEGIEDSYQVAVIDPTHPDATPRFVYLMKAAEDGPSAAFDETNGYVRYQRDADSNVFLFSESGYEGYGATFHGPWFDPATGVCHSAEGEWLQHRPGDQATISTPRYQFRYEGRWLMTELHVAANDDWNYGPDLVDQWKARAFQQRPGGDTPCCGYEEEVTNWGGSSILMGELSGPVRTIRETWGADSGTNVVRREIFYRDEVRLGSFLRVHVIPPGDGIYAQWDYNAGLVDTYYNPENPDGVAIDGQNDEEVFGNDHVYVSRDGVAYDPNGNGEVGTPHGEDCPGDPCFNNDSDSPDPTHSGVNAGLNWEEIAGPNGTLVTRTQIKQVTGGTGYSVVAVPYYRDDSCFDDGTGSNPGAHLHGGEVDEGTDATYTDETGTHDRQCWAPDDGTPAPAGDRQFWQGSIGTHGVHILLIADSDNAHTTAPLTEIDSEQRIVVLPPTLDNVGEAYGRQPEKPLVTLVVTPEARAQAEPEPTETETPEPTTTETESPSPEPTETEDPDESPRPSQTKSPSPKPSQSESPEPTPNTAPQAKETSVTFGEMAFEGQYSDAERFAARVTERDSGAPVEGAEVTFELIGADASKTFTAATNGDGVATVSPTLDVKPGSYVLDGRYAGNGNAYNASADQASYVVKKEKAELVLTARSGRLIAKLVDPDTEQSIDGRKIRFFAAGDKVGADATNSNGKAKIAIPRRLRDAKQFRAEFAGNAFYRPAADRDRPRG